MFIDCHMHAFADNIADKAVAQLIDYYHVTAPYTGRVSEVMAVAAEVKLDGLVLLVAATRPTQVKPANNWVLSMRQEYLAEQAKAPNHTPRIAHFGTYHPGDPNWLAEIRRLRAAGITGIKIHPEFQGIDLADPKLNAFFEEVKNDFVLLIHVGDPVVTPDNASTPRKIARILDNFPGIKIIAAHMGGYLFWEEAYDCLAGRDVYLDTSSSLCYMDLDLARKIICKHGTDKVLFGSDFPLHSPADEAAIIHRISWLTSSDKEKILGLNCAELLPQLKG
ncbi:TPA: amidohydrolase [Candidatus Sumerlaeota bacterium]|nr:amidohydrolase [Candidatus Sumerlaeota bacterium]